MPNSTSTSAASTDEQDAPVPAAEPDAAVAAASGASDDIAGRTRELVARLARLTRADRLSAEDRTALRYWIAAHVVLMMLAWTAAWTMSKGSEPTPLRRAFQNWDAIHYATVAAHGYFSGASLPTNIVFFPGYPAVIAAVHLVVRDWPAAELIASFVAGAFAVVSLTRLAGSSRAALYLLVAPAAVFLSLGYAESLYLAFSLAAWQAAGRGHWVRAGLFGLFAGVTRVNAVFLVAALAVMALQMCHRDGVRSLVKAWAGLAITLLGPVGYITYLRLHTGSWSAWFQASRAGWDLHFVGPVKSLHDSWYTAFTYAQTPEVSFTWQLEILAVAVMVLTTLWLLYRRQWPEAIYCGLTVTAVATTTYYTACDRTLLLLFPIWVLLTRAAKRWPWVGTAYVWCSAPLAAVVALMYLSGNWAG